MIYKILNKDVPKEYPLIEKVFFSRGIQRNEINHYLNTSKKDIIDPSQLKNIKDGAIMLIKHIKNNDDIFIQVDSDCDGMTSAAALINYLYYLFPAYIKAHLHYRIHDGKQHGLIFNTIPSDVKLVIAPDSSSNDYDIHKQLADLGIDVLVLDHHEAEKISPYACVINNQLCDYPNKTLSGAGIVYKFCSYIDNLLNSSYANDILDLTAIGMIGDMMDVRNLETIELMRQGLDNIKNPFISELKAAQAYSINKHGYFDLFAVSFYIAPMINAILRSGTTDERLLVFEAMLNYKAYEQIPSTRKGAKNLLETRVDQAVRTCKTVKSRQTKANEKLLAIAEEKLKDSDDCKILIVLMNGEIDNRNLTGLLANQLAGKYHRPTLVLNYNDDDSWDGSGRNYENSPILDLRHLIESTNLVEYAQGHAGAFGVKFASTDVLAQFTNTINTLLADINFEPCYWVDAIYVGDTIIPKDVLDIANLKPIWGQNFSEPLIALERVVIHSNNIAIRSPNKYPTLVITLNNGIELIKFGLTEKEIDLFNNLNEGCMTMNIIGKCDRNIFNYNITPQIKIDEYEITSQCTYYF